MYQNNLTNKEQYDQNQNLLECLIHFDILVDPVLCQNASCRKIQCKQCVDQLPISLNNNPKCPNCHQSPGFTTIGTTNTKRMLDNLVFKCVKCTANHSYSAAANCDQNYCESCDIFYNDNKNHYCFKCQRCNKKFKTIEQLREHVEYCKPNHDQNINQQIKNEISEMWNVINQINRNLIFVFNSILTILENKNLIDGFENQHQDSAKYGINNFKSDIGVESDEEQFIKTEYISELDLRVIYKNDSLEIQDCQNCKKIGSLDNDHRIESNGLTPNLLINYYTSMKIRKEQLGQEDELASCLLKILNMVTKARPTLAEQEDPIPNQDIKSYGSGTLQFLNENIKKISVNNWDTMARLEKPLREGCHYFRLRIDDSSQETGIFIGFVDEQNTNPSAESIINNFIGIHNKGSCQNYGINFHYRNWQAYAGDVIDIEVDFNMGQIKFSLGGTEIADASTNQQCWSTLYLAIYIYWPGDSVSILECN